MRQTSEICPIPDAVLPRLAFRVGFVGNRKIDRVEEPSLKACLSEILEIVEVRAKELRQEPSLSPLFSDQDPQLMLISSLAEGADMIACEKAIDMGWNLHLVLPFPADEFKRQSLRGNVALQNRFDAILGKAHSCFVMDLPPGLTDKDARDRAYAAAARMTIDYSDILIAMWNGEDSHGPGGTAESIQLAREADLPVVHIPVKAQSRPRLINPENKNLEYLREAMTALVAMPECGSGVGSEQTEPRQRYIRYLREATPRSKCGNIFRWARQLLLQSRSKQWDVKPERWPQSPQPMWPAVIQNCFERLDTRADRLAVHYAGWTRDTFTVNCIMSAIALTAAIAQKLWPCVQRPCPSMGPRIAINAVGTVASVIAIALYLYARRRQVHARWIEYRILAEL